MSQDGARNIVHKRNGVIVNPPQTKPRPPTPPPPPPQLRLPPPRERFLPIPELTANITRYESLPMPQSGPSAYLSRKINRSNLSLAECSRNDAPLDLSLKPSTSAPYNSEESDSD